MNDLIKAAQGTLPAVIKNTEMDAMLAADAVSFLPYVTFLQPQSKLAQEPENLPKGDFVITENSKPTAMGPEIDVMLLEVRMLAWQFGPAINTRVYDMDNPLFAEIKAKGDTSQDKLRAEGDPDSYSWGTEYLIYLPQFKKVATFYASTKSNRKSALDDFHDLVAERAVVTWKTHWHTSKGAKPFSWYLLHTEPCNTVDQYDVPDMDMLASVITEFQNPETIEAVEAVEGEDQ